MIINQTVDTSIDTLGIRCECDNVTQRDSLFNAIIDFLIERNLVAIRYNKKRSNKYYQITELLYGNTKLASIAKGHYVNDTSFNPDYYYINISFYGLKRYNKTKDKASNLLVKTITAFLNTYNIDFRLTELDIAMDIKSKIDNIIAMRVSRSPNVDYYQLGDTDNNGNYIQDNKGTYYIERYYLNEKEQQALQLKIQNAKTEQDKKNLRNNAKQKINKKIKNAISRAYLYDKRLKEIDKFKRDIGFDLTRFEVKFQQRFFVKNEFSFLSRYKLLKKYVVLQFEDIEKKEQFIQKYNSAKTSKRRKEAVEESVSDNSAILLTQRMNKVGEFLREIDTMKFNTKGEFIYTKHEDYLESRSKFNRKY